MTLTNSLSEIADRNPDDSLASTPDVTAIIVNYNTKELLEECIAALQFASTDLSLQIVVVDNASRDGSVALLRERFGFCDLVINERNVGFGRANNQALLLARGRYVLLLNTDAFITSGAISDAVRYMEERPELGLLGARLVGRDGGLQPSCRYFPTPWNEFLVQTGFNRFCPKVRLVDDLSWDHAQPRLCDWVPGCFYLVPRHVVDAVGLFDPRFFLYYEEVDHCKIVKAAGWGVVYYPYVKVLHIGGESAKADSTITEVGRQISSLQIESGLLYYRKHYGWKGLVAIVVLSSFGDAVLIAKWVLAGRSFGGSAVFRKHLSLMWSLLWRTKWAQRPTR